jgi:hypothetical protein
MLAMGITGTEVTKEAATLVLTDEKRASWLPSGCSAGNRVLLDRIEDANGATTP